MSSTTARAAAGITALASSNVNVITLAIGGIGAVVALATLFSRKTANKTVDEKPLPVAPPGSKFIRLPASGITLRYTDTGSVSESKTATVTFLLLHGFAGVLETWDFLTPYLLEHSETSKAKNDTESDTKINTRVVAIDMVGSGFSDMPDGADFDYAYRNQGTVVSELISVLGMSNVVLVGHSSGTVVGASTAVEIATSASGSGASTSPVVGVVFVANALFRSKSDFFSKPWLKPLFRWMVTMMTADRKKSLARMHSEVHADRVLTDDFVGKFAAPTRLPKFHDAMVETVMAKEAPYEDLFDKLLSLTPSQNEGRTPVPMLFVFGKQDTYKPLPSEQRESISQKLAAMDATVRKQQRVEITELEECHHYAQHEQPEALAKEIRGFVQTHVVLQ